MPKPTIVLVHGAWADASSWNAVASELQSQGFTVLAPPNLLRGVATDAAYIASFLAQRTSGPVVLVGHSYGGFVITNAGTGGGDVRALVYVDAFVPDEGETVFQILGGSGSALDVPDPTTVLDIVGYPDAPEGDAEAFLKPDTVHNSFAQDLSESGPLADRREPAADHAEREHHPVRRRGLEDAAELGGGRHRGPGHPAGHPAQHGGARRAPPSPTSPGRTSRWCRTRRSPSTRSWPPSPPSATDEVGCWPSNIVWNGAVSARSDTVALR